MKSQKALIAITRKILVIIYNVLKTEQGFDPKKNTSYFVQSTSVQANKA